MAGNTGVAVPDRIVPMRVVVCGVHRTGSLSMRSALWQLGFHDCHHMHSVLEDLSRVPEWIRAFEAKYAGKGTFGREDWDKLLGHCQACCDLPSAFFGAELAEAYPDAKVVILNREPEKWYESVLNTIHPMLNPSSPVVKLRMMYCAIFDEGTRQFAAFGKAMSTYGLPFDHGKEKEKAIAWFNNQYNEFRERIPADRRLEYNIKDGWKPLCDHLGVPVPMVKDEATGEMVEAPFPRLNDRSMFKEQGAKIRSNSTARAHGSFWRLMGKVAVTGAVGYAGFLAWRARLGGRA